MISNRDGKIKYANQKFMEYFQLSRSQLDQINTLYYLDHLSASGEEQWEVIKQDLETDGFCRNRLVELVVEGTSTLFIVSATRLFLKGHHLDAHILSFWQKLDLQKLGDSKIIHQPSKDEIEEQRTIEQDLIDYRFRLEDLVRQRTEELQQQNLELEKEIAERKRAELAEREQRAIAEALGNTAAILNRTPNLDRVLDNILKNLEKVVPHDSANVMLIDGQGIANVVRYKGRPQTSSDQPPVSSFFVDQTPTLRKMRDTLMPLVISEVAKDPDWIAQIGSSWINSYVAAPLFFGDQFLGYLNLVSAEEKFYNEITGDRLLAFASHASIAIRNAQLFNQEREFAAIEERQRLAREMHDAVSQTLFTASVVAETLPIQWERNPEKGMEGLEKIQRLTKGALAEMRTILLELRPEALANADLGDLIHQLGQGAKSYLEINLTSDINGKYPLPEDVHLTIYRMAQEIFNNIVKHARATHVHIEYNNQDGYVFLSITDNGKGFNTTELKDDRLGLKIMQERADSIGASLDILSQPDTGTNITIIWHESEKEGE